MKVIVTYRNFRGVDREDMPPEVFYIEENESPAIALRRIWESQYNALLGCVDEEDPLVKSGCWYEEDMAMITWFDGDTKEFYVIDIEHYWA